MEKITLPKASVLTSPNPVTLVCTQKPDGGTNLATVSWWTYLSYNPGMIAYAMGETPNKKRRRKDKNYNCQKFCAGFDALNRNNPDLKSDLVKLVN